MSQMISLPALELLLIAGRAVALVLGLLIFAWAFRHWRRAAMHDTQRVFEQLDLVRSELLIMKEVMHHSTHRESSYREVSHRNDAPSRITTFDSRVPVAPTSGTARGYEIAARMARNGAGKDELIRGCGITSHEAELLVKLHGHKHADGRGASAAELIGRQPRTVESATFGNGVSAATAATSAATSESSRQQTTAQVLQSHPRQAATAQRQTVAATSATQRTPSAPVKSQGLPPRSRLVAVG